MRNETTSLSNPSIGFLSHRLALLTWAVVWPVITLLLELLQPVVRDWPLPFRTLLLSGLMVALISLWLMPLLTRRCANWLRGDDIFQSQTKSNPYKL